MRKIYIVLCVLLINTSFIYAYTWDDCIDRYKNAKKFQDNTELLYVYLKSTKNCLINFKKSLENNPNPEFTTQAMDNNIEIIDKNIEQIIPKYKYPKNELNHIPMYHDLKELKYREEYDYIKKFKSCNGIHAKNNLHSKTLQY